MRPFIDHTQPASYKAAVALAKVVRDDAEAAGLSFADTELIKVRASQINGCVACLNVHTEDARKAGISQQQLDIMPGWRETDLFSEREKALLHIAEAATRLPLTEESIADLDGARRVLGDAAFGAAEWVALTINAFNRISILSGHPARKRPREQ